MVINLETLVSNILQNTFSSSVRKLCTSQCKISTIRLKFKILNWLTRDSNANNINLNLVIQDITTIQMSEHTPCTLVILILHMQAKAKMEIILSNIRIQAP